MAILCPLGGCWRCLLAAAPNVWTNLASPDEAPNSRLDTVAWRLPPRAERAASGLAMLAPVATAVVARRAGAVR